MATYPNITWPLFAAYNADARKSFEDMCRRLFTSEFLKDQVIPHTDPNLAGIEVLPVLEPERDDGQPRKRISFQAKYTDQNSADYNQIKDSAQKTVKHHKGNLDRVYLFCNRPLNTANKQYRDIVDIHLKADIETVPISDCDLLDLVVKHRQVADYYFQPRRVADASAKAIYPVSGVTMDQVTGNLIISPSVFQQEPLNGNLLKELVSEKLHTCREYALSLELDALKDELGKLFTYEIEHVDGCDEIYYYKTLCCVHDGQDPDEYLDKCGPSYHDEANWIAEFYKNPTHLTEEEFKKHTPITQVFAIDRLFIAQFWNDIIELYEGVRENSDPAIFVQLDLYYGLSLLNLQSSEKASRVLHDLFEKTKQPRILLYATFADLRIENSVYQSGRNGNREALNTLLTQLNGFKDLKQYKQQELLVAVLTLESLYHLGLSDKSCLERAIKEYDSYSAATRSHIAIQYYYALCLELNGNLDAAISVYEGLQWRQEPGIVERYMTVLLLRQEPEKIKTVFHELGAQTRTVRTEALYLLALDRSGDGTYLNSLKSAIDAHSDNLEELYLISYYTDRPEAIQEIVLPALRRHVSAESLGNLILPQKIELITFLAHCRETELMELVLTSIEDVASLNTAVVGEIYKALFDVTAKEYAKQSNNLQKPEDFEAADRITDRFLSTDTAKKLFLQIKVLCVGARQMPFSSLHYAKELFKLSPDMETARIIVALLFDRKEMDARQYEPYLELLKKSEKPDHCMVVASALLILGHEELAEYYAYKALYYLNGEDDFDTYKSYFSFFNYHLHGLSQVSIRSARGSVVLMLEETSPEGEPNRLELCLDSEAELDDQANRSLGIEHLSVTSPEYLKLHGSGLRQELNFRGKRYKVIQILPRNQYCFGYILRKIQENPEKFNGVAYTISTENIEDALSQMKALSDNSENVKARLNAYHFEDNEIGLPIDSVASCNYSRYVNTVRYLLFGKDEALYTGEPVYDDETGQKYVPTLSTFVLLAVMGKLEILDAFKPVLIIPDSYLAFFREEYARASSVLETSSSTLLFVEDKPYMQEPDKTIPDIWGAIVDFCSECEVLSVTDQERIDYHVNEDLTGESLMSGLWLNSIHLDALIMAQREGATLLCDDLFFRRIATAVGIRNLNTVSLIQHFRDEEYMSSLLMEFSRTNYIYVPLFPRNDKEAQEFYQNITSGEKKKHYYGALIRGYNAVREQLLHELLGDDYDNIGDNAAEERL